MSEEANKQLVRRLVDEVVRRRDPVLLDEVAEAEFAEIARRWISPFRGSFPDFSMELVGLVAEGDQIVAHLKCSGTHTGEWLGVPPTGERFENVDEIYIFTVHLHSAQRKAVQRHRRRGQPLPLAPAWARPFPSVRCMGRRLASAGPGHSHGVIDPTIMGWHAGLSCGRRSASVGSA